MTDEAALLAAIAAAPGDDTPRLVYADRLDETAGTVPCQQCKDSGKEGHVHRHGKHGPGYYPCPVCSDADGYPTGRIPDGRAARAEFIRVQVELAKPPAEMEVYRIGPNHRYIDDGRGALRKREGELLAVLHPRTSKDGYWEVEGNRVLFGPGETSDTEYEYRRGFLEVVTCTAAAWFGGWQFPSRCSNGTRFAGEHIPSDDGKLCLACGTGRTPALADALVWKPEVECPGCSGTRWKDSTIRGIREQCPDCSGKGTVRNPDPPPSTAQPVREVALTSVPDVEMEWRRESRVDRSPRALWLRLAGYTGAKWVQAEPGRPHAQVVMEAEFPGITFTLPAGEPASA
jgi:hypothetical protein